MCKFNKLASVLLAVLLLFSLAPAGAMAQTTPEERDISAQSEGAQVSTAKGMQKVLENSAFVMNCDLGTGFFDITDKKSGKRWTSNPENWQDDAIASGYDQLLLSSQMMVAVQIFTKEDTDGVKLYYGSYLDVNRKGELRYKQTNDALILVYDFKELSVSIPVKYTLSDTGFTYEVLTNEISEYGTDNKYGYRNLVMEVDMLPAFGAGSAEDDGYMLVPDGSGALIHYNNNKPSAQKYKVETWYGLNNGLSDFTYSTMTQNKNKQTYAEALTLGMFGAKCNDDGYVAVIKQGDAKALLYAQSGGLGSEYNMIYPGYHYREVGGVRMTQKGFKQKSEYIIEKQNGSDENFVVEYIFLENGNADYAAMAQAYRGYLQRDGSLGQALLQTDIPFYLDLYGYIRKSKPFFGIPKDTKIPMTSFEQASEIVGKLQDGGVNNIALRYNYWAKRSYFDKLPTSLSTQGTVGSKKELAALQDALTASGGKLFLASDPMNAYKNGNGFTTLGGALRSVAKTPQKQYVFALSTAAIDARYEPWHMVRPDKMTNFFDKYLNSFAKLGIGNISPDTIGSMLYSEIGSGGTTRNEAKSITQELISKAAGLSGELMLNGANSYAGVYANHIINTPLKSSNFGLIDEDIPFYQMVFHGYVNYSLLASNLSSNPAAMHLQCLETGASPMYSWVAQNSNELIASRRDDLFSADYTRWLDFAIEDYQKINSVLSRVSAMPITGHANITENLSSTVYGGETEIVVNYEDKEQTYKGYKIPAKGYIAIVDGKELNS